MGVLIYINGARVAKGTKYDYDFKKDNDVQDTFDGPDVAEAEYGQWTVKISRLVTFDPNFERTFENALKSNIPIVIKDTVNGQTLTDTYSSCYLDSTSGSRDPKKKLSEDLSFKSLDRTRKWS